MIQMQERVIAGRYRVLDLIRTKGLARIYRATDEATGAVVALRVVPGSEKNRSGHLSREFGIGSQLSHPAVPKYLEFLRLEDCDCLVTELVEGPPLLSGLPRAEDMTLVARAVDAFGQLHEAVGYLHEQKLIHANLIPGNLLLAAGDKVMLVDLGHCEKLGASESFWQSEFHGTLRYCSPEHFSGSLTPESDYFVVGILLLEYVTGTRALSCDHMSAVPDELRGLHGAAAKLQALGGDVRRAILLLLSWTAADRRAGWESLASVVKREDEDIGA